MPIDVFFQVIENLGAGKGFLVAAAVGLGICFAASGIIKFYESIRKVSKEKRALEREKSRLELLRLHYEIKALKKQNKLKTIYLGDDILSFWGQEKEEPKEEDLGRQKITQRFAIRLWQWGAIGRGILYLITFVLQLFGWVSTVFWIGYIIFVILHPTPPWDSASSWSWEDGLISILGLLLGILALFFGIWRFGVLLRKKNRYASSSINIITIGAGIGMLVAQIMIHLNISINLNISPILPP